MYIEVWRRSPSGGGVEDVIAVGDIMLGRGIREVMASNGPDFPFERIHDELISGDIAFGNLECTITDRGTPSLQSLSHFRTPPEAAQALKRAGFDVLNLANNHIYDYTGLGAKDTLNHLRKEGIATIGLGDTLAEARRPAELDVGGLRVAFLGYTTLHNVIDHRQDYVAVAADLKCIAEDVACVHAQGARCVVSLHFGYENVEFPPPACRTLAHAIADMGVDAIIGHHPHVAQGMEVHNGTLIAYSLGNFVFDNLNDRRRIGLLLRLSLDSNGLQRAGYVPLHINDRGQVSVAEGPLGVQVQRRIATLSEHLQNGTSDRLFWTVAGDDFVRAQSSSLGRVFRRNGLLHLLGKIRHLRLIHVRLLVRWVVQRVVRRRNWG